MTKNQTKTIDFKPEILKLGFEIIKLKDFYALNYKNIKSPRVINFYVILFITRGDGIHEVDFKSYEYSKNSIIFINKGQENRWVEHENTNGYMFLFTDDFLQKQQIRFKEFSYWFFNNHNLHVPILNLQNKEANFLNILANLLHVEYKQNTHEHKAKIIQSLFRTFLLKINAFKPQITLNATIEQKDLYIKFFSLVNERIGQSRNINDYCKWLKVSYKKLNLTCKAFTNKTAKNHLDDILLLKAKQLLIENQKNISEIAFYLGFIEPTNFTKFFKKHTRYSPKEFKNSLSLV